MRPLLYAVPLLALAGHGAAHAVAFSNGTVEALGVCDVTPETVACWDMGGKPSLSILSLMRGQLEYSANGSFHPGLKNRILVFKRTGPTLQVEYRSESMRTLNGGSDYGYERRTDFVPYGAELQETQAKVTLSATVPVKGKWDVPFRIGAKIRVDGREVEVGGVRRVTDEEWRQVAPSPDLSLPRALWSVVLSVESENPWARFMAFVPLDASGKPIRYVDIEGRPISAAQALTLEPTLPMNNGYQGDLRPSEHPRAAAAFFSPNQGGPAFAVNTNIDPQWIAKLELLPSRRVSAILGPFPLDPR